jgi:hypothetical protein
VVEHAHEMLVGGGRLPLPKPQKAEMEVHIRQISVRPGVGQTSSQEPRRRRRISCTLQPVGEEHAVGRLQTRCRARIQPRKRCDGPGLVAGRNGRTKLIGAARPRRARWVPRLRAVSGRPPDRAAPRRAASCWSVACVRARASTRPRCFGHRRGVHAIARARACGHTNDSDDHGPTQAPAGPRSCAPKDAGSPRKNGHGPPQRTIRREMSRAIS